MCVDALYSPDQGAAAAGASITYARFAATLDGSAAAGSMAAFDADSFRLTKAEAAVMDPQGRLLLEHTAEAVADAQGRLVQHSGTAADMSASATGVYAGCMWATGRQELARDLGVAELCSSMLLPISAHVRGTETMSCSSL